MSVGQDLGMALLGALWVTKLQRKQEPGASVITKADGYQGSPADGQVPQVWGSLRRVVRGTAAYSPHMRVPRKREEERAPQMGATSFV